VVTNQRTLVIQSSISALSLVIFFAMIFQFIFALSEKRNMIVIFTLIGGILNLLLNTVFFVFYQFQLDDYQFN